MDTLSLESVRKSVFSEISPGYAIVDPAGFKALMDEHVCSTEIWNKLRATTDGYINFPEGYSFSSFALKGLNLTRCNLDKTIFACTTLHDVCLDDSHMIGANFKYAKLVECSLVRVNANKANFREAKINSCHLRTSSFREAIFQGSQLHSTVPVENKNIQDCIFIDADFSDSRWKNVLVNDSDFTGAYFFGAKLEKVELEDSELISTNISNLRIRNGHLKGVDLESAYSEYWAPMEIAGTTVVKTNFAHTKLRAATIQYSSVAESIFIGTDLRDAVLDRCNFLSQEKVDALKFENTLIRKSNVLSLGLSDEVAKQVLADEVIVNNTHMILITDLDVEELVF